ncbi:uncharacterized protein LOC114517269 [Dendronephthya gigantea]|uniref:uncharacterized protein LOC114517269 n=1 Tax=Dendronephthya gigantea TaxID=151771 RepID=UPI00106D411F|nr:uncharacterized protein LOC114517269 [Dendronephthya gigantea]
MAEIKLFLEKVTAELIYNVVFAEVSVDYEALSEKFEMKTGHKPMELFGFDMIKKGSHDDLSDFLKAIPGLKISAENTVTIGDNSPIYSNAFGTNKKYGDNDLYHNNSIYDDRDIFDEPGLNEDSGIHDRDIYDDCGMDDDRDMYDEGDIYGVFGTLDDDRDIYDEGGINDDSGINDIGDLYDGLDEDIDKYDDYDCDPYDGYDDIDEYDDYNCNPYDGYDDIDKYDDYDYDPYDGYDDIDKYDDYDCDPYDGYDEGNVIDVTFSYNFSDLFEGNSKKTRYIYNVFNTTNMDENCSVASYREKLLLKCCDIMKANFANLSNCKDENGNTPLHLLAALPGITFDCDTLVKHLLKAGIDPLAANINGQTFLHIIFGRFEVVIDENCNACFKSERVVQSEWFVDDQTAVLNLISKELSTAQVTSLSKAQDKNGNTVLHEYALFTSLQQELPHERNISEELLNLDAGLSLRIPNTSGEIPLHYAHNPLAFTTFVQKEIALCRKRNDRDETPILFMVKMSAELAFSQTSASEELATSGFVDITSRRSVQKAAKLLENLLSIAEENEEAVKAAWIPDLKGNTAIDVVLIAIRISAYDLDEISEQMASLRSSLVELLRILLRNASPSNMTRRNKKAQSPLHVILDIGDNNKHKIVEESCIRQCVEFLLMHDADVKSVDLEGCTPLDIAHKHRHKAPSLFKECAELLLKGKIEARKLQSCPKRHVKNAERLIHPNSEVSIVGKYRYSRVDAIGSGAFSAVFVAIKDEYVDLKSGTIQCRAYALKRRDKARMNLGEFTSEMTALLSLSGKCENIIKFHECIEDPRNIYHYLSLDLMDGNLAEFVLNGVAHKVFKGNPALHVRAAKDIVNGVAFIHNQEFVHCDLKPRNILYTTDLKGLRFKIADFGLTRSITTSSALTSSGGDCVPIVLGTRCWMAPELINMESSEHTQHSDLFSLGLVLHYLLTMGKHPFATGIKEPAHVIEQRIRGMQILVEKSLEPEATDSLHALLSKDPAQRPPATCLNEHPFLWCEKKKIEFLKAIGDQLEAVNPGKYPNSQLEKSLQNTPTGMEVQMISWDQPILSLFAEMKKAWKRKPYRTDKVIDLIRFIRNSYAHKQERSLMFQQDVDNNIFLRKYQTLVLDAFGVVRKLGYDTSRSNIHQVLSF